MAFIKSWGRFCVFGLLALGFANKASALQISQTSSTNFYVDFSSDMRCDYVSFAVTNSDGVAYSNLWVTLDGFTNGVLSLAGGDIGQYGLGTLANNQSKPAFFYLQSTNDPGNSGTGYPCQFTVKVFQGFPAAGGVVLATHNFVLNETTSGQNQANKVSSLTYAPTNNPVVGGVLKITVQGTTGNVQVGNDMAFTAATFTNWNAGAFQFVGCNIVITDSPNYVLTNTLDTTSASHITGSGDPYTAQYWFRAIATTPSTTPVSPVNFLNNGGGTVNHVQESTLQALSPVLPATNMTTLNALTNFVQLYTNQTVTFTLRVTNASVFDVMLDRFVDLLPAGLVYVAGSSTFGGVSILDPTNINQTLTWAQTYAVPAGTSRDLIFQAIPTNTVSSYFTNSCVAYVQNSQIDTTLNTSDNAPATEVVRALIAPVAGNISTNVLENQVLNVAAPGVLANTTEPNGFAVTLIGYTQPANGNVTVNPDGSYTYTPAAFYNGPDAFTFTITNQNGRASTGTNSISVVPVNQPPTINPISNLALTENWRLQTVNFDGVTAGPTNESSQILTVTATSSNPSLIPNPTVNYTSPNTSGSLNFTPVTNSFGAATITVVVKDNGGTANGGVDSVTNTFIVTEQGVTNYWFGGSNLVVNIFDATGGAGSGFSQTNYTGVLSVLSTDTNPFIIRPTGLAANFNSQSNYTWTIATTTRGVIGLLSSNQFIFDTSAFTNDLAGGYFTIGLSPDGSSVNLIYVGNHGPTAGPATYSRAFNSSLRIPIQDLLTNYTSDPDGDARILVSAGVSTNGSIIETNSLFIQFGPTNNLTESFPYVIRDARYYRPGDTILYSTNWLTIVAVPTVGYANTITSLNNGNYYSIKFAGIPGYAYDVQRATNLSGPWVTLLITNAPPNGIWFYLDTNPPQSAAFYRTQQH